MPDISYDGRSFSIDGRRVWLVSGSLDYTRVPQGQWRDRVRAAKQAGLNCIATTAVWSAHEQAPGEISFEGDLDLRAFIQIVADQGMHCILRAGPYVGNGYDFGGLPGYLHGVADRKGNKVRYREAEPQYMEAADRFIRAMMQQVSDLQITSPDGGPIVLVESEHAWLCQNPDKGAAYLERLVSMLRQHGCAVPIVNTHNLWQQVEGTIDTWNGSQDLPAMMRQIATVRPGTPPIAMDMTVGGHDPWADQPAPPLAPDGLTHQLAGLIGVGAQFNLSPFHAGNRTGLINDANASAQAVLGEAGERGKSYLAAKRLCTFASQFGHVLAARDSQPAPITALNEDHPAALLHQRGNQGEVVMIVKSKKDKTKHTNLMLPNGLTLEIPHAGQRAAWTLINTNLGGMAQLDYTSFSPWALIDRKLLVVFGPANSRGVISIDGTHHAVTVPTGKTPLVIKGDPVHIAVLNHEQIDTAYLTKTDLVIGCDGLDETNSPIPRKGWGTQFTISADAQVHRKRVNQPAKPTTPRLGKWQTLTLKPLVDGSDDSYRPIDTPASLGALGQAHGYGWYRFNTPKPTSGKTLLHRGGDRLHLYQNNKLTTMLGKGDDASDELTTLKLSGSSVFLADNLGRASWGQSVGADPKGVPDDLYALKPIKLGNPEHTIQPAGDPFAIDVLAFHQQAGVRPMGEALTWTIKPESRKPILLEIEGLDQPCAITINEEPAAFYAAQYAGHRMRLLLDPADDGPMTGGKNAISLELLQPLAEGVQIANHVRIYQTTGKLTQKDGWAFAPWSVPAADHPDWRDVPKSLPSQPAWVCASFTPDATDRPLWLEPHGMSKGVVVLNGKTLGRYWVQTRTGKQVRPDERFYLPESMLHTDQPNTLMLFDEHGRTPEKCRLTYDA